MPAKLVKKVWLFAVSVAVLAGFLLYQTDVQRRKSIRGNAIFAASEQLSNIKKMELLLPKHQITLYQDENIWRVLEEDNYFADLKVLQNIQKEISLGKIGRTVTPDNKQLVWSTVKLYDASEKVLDEVQIANATEIGQHYIRYSDKSPIYLSNWQINMPDELTAWTQQPLLDFDGRDINAFEKNGIGIFRDDKGETFFNEKNNRPYREFDYMKAFEALTNVWYEQVVSVQNFQEEKYPYSQKLEFSTFDGLITELDIYTDYKEYWVKITQSQARLAKMGIAEYIKNNEAFYQDWWFKLPQNAGRTLYMFNFNL